MTINPCCIPLKTGVRMVTHLSMALALAVGWTSLKLISISSEVSSNVETTTTSTGVIRASDSRGGGLGSNNIFMEQQPPPPPPPQSFYNAHIFENHQVPPQYRIPYEYFLYHKWHQQQQQMMQQQQNSGVEGYPHNFDSQQHHHHLQPQRPYYDDTFFTWYQQHHQRLQQQLFPSHFEREGGGNGVEHFSAPSGVPVPASPHPPPLQEQEHQRHNWSSPLEKTVDNEGDEEDEHSKIFRSVLHQRKNFKGAVPASSSSVPSGDLTSRRIRARNVTREEALTEDDTTRATTTTTGSASLTSPQLTSSAQRESKMRERGQFSKDRSSSSSSPAIFPVANEGARHTIPPSQVGVRNGTKLAAVEVPLSSSTSAAQSPRSSTTLVRRQWQQRKQPPSEQRQQEGQGENAHEVEKPRTMMMMMSKLTRENSQRDDGAGYYGGITGKSGTSSSKKLFPDFKEQYAKTLLVCGLLALCTVVFQFLTSFLLLCFVDKGSNAAAQIWTAVHCSVIFCLSTCLVLFLCEGLSMPKYVFDETVYLSLVTIDSLLSIYFLWVVMAFI